MYWAVSVAARACEAACRPRYLRQSFTDPDSIDALSMIAEDGVEHAIEKPGSALPVKLTWDAPKFDLLRQRAARARHVLRKENRKFCAVRLCNQLRL
jgi:hypothetical protein